MRKTIPFISILILVFSATSVSAQSSASVNIQNNVNSSNNSESSDVESKTDITVETNGNVTHYTSDEPNQKIEVKSINGQSSIMVDGVEKSNSPTASTTPTPTLTPEEKITPTPTPMNKIKEIIKENFGFIEKIFSFLGF